MSFLKKFGKILLGGILGGPAGAITVFTVEHRHEVVECIIDTAQRIVKIGTDVYRAIPPEAFLLAGDPLQALLKHEYEDELILLGEIAGNMAIFSAIYWAAAGPIGASLAIAQGAIPLYVNVGSLIGKIHHRKMNDQEWEMARYIFRDSLYDRSQIIFTSLGGIDGRAFVFPASLYGEILVNLGHHYVHDSTIPDGPTLFHELTHVWQAKEKLLTEVFLYDALNRNYNFTLGHQWSEYGMEQQASIVEAWTLGAKLPGGRVHKPLAIASPLFRYINGNVRRSNNGARTGSGRSVRQLLADGGHRTMEGMYSRLPKIWWS